MASRISKIWKSSHRPMRVPVTPWTCCKTISNSMIGLKKPRIRNRQPKTLLQLAWRKHWLIVGAAVCTTVFAGPPPAGPPAPPAQSAPPAASQGAPDDEFIEFLGRDDVGG